MEFYDVSFENGENKSQAEIPESVAKYILFFHIANLIPSKK
jgi:hypothetical protein